MRQLVLLELGLSHFRSHDATRLELDGRPVAIWGPNGAGKTNILEAISLLSPGRGLRRATADQIGRRPANLGWKVTATLRHGAMLHEIETWSEPGQSRQVRIDGKMSTQVALGHAARVLWLVPVMDRLWLEGAEGRRRFLDRVTMSFEPQHGEQVLAYEKAMRERNRLLRDHVGDPSWFGALEGRMAAAGESIIAARARSLERLARAQEDAETVFPRAALDLTEPEGEVPSSAEGLASLWSSSRARDMAAGRTLVGPHRTDLAGVYSDKGVAAEQCSTGEQKALLISLCLANARALIDEFGAAPILLLDEVAAHLDAARRAALYDEICALGAQAFMTGTGVELFEQLGARAQGFAVSDTNGRSVIEGREIA